MWRDSSSRKFSKTHTTRSQPAFWCRSVGSFSKSEYQSFIQILTAESLASNHYVANAACCLLRRVDSINIPALTAYLSKYHPLIPPLWREPIVVAVFAAAHKVAVTHNDTLKFKGERAIMAEQDLARWAHGLSAIEPSHSQNETGYSSHRSSISGEHMSRYDQKRRNERSASSSPRSSVSSSCSHSSCSRKVNKSKTVPVIPSTSETLQIPAPQETQLITDPAGSNGLTTNSLEHIQLHSVSTPSKPQSTRSSDGNFVVNYGDKMLPLSSEVFFAKPSEQYSPTSNYDIPETYRSKYTTERMKQHPVSFESRQALDMPFDLQIIPDEMSSDIHQTLTADEILVQTAMEAARTATAALDNEVSSDQVEVTSHQLATVNMPVESQPLVMVQSSSHFADTVPILDQDTNATEYLKPFETETRSCSEKEVCQNDGTHRAAIAQFESVDIHSNSNLSTLKLNVASVDIDLNMSHESLLRDLPTCLTPLDNSVITVSKQPVADSTPPILLSPKIVLEDVGPSTSTPDRQGLLKKKNERTVVHCSDVEPDAESVPCERGRKRKVSRKIKSELDTTGAKKFLKVSSKKN